MRAIIVALGIAAIGVWTAGAALAGDLMYGCRSQPACGKVCKLVCGTATLVAVGYGCECKEICIPGPSRPGCKHCYTTCCCGNDMKGCPPKIEFCWYDWFACGCAQPRTVRVLTKYQAEKEICSYHWEVVDGCNCCCPGKCHCVYKSAPPEAQVGDVIDLTNDEQVQLTSWMSSERPELAASLADTAELANDGPVAAPDASSTVAPKEQEASTPTAWQRAAKVWPFSRDAN